MERETVPQRVVDRIGIGIGGGDGLLDHAEGRGGAGAQHRV